VKIFFVFSDEATHVYSCLAPGTYTCFESGVKVDSCRIPVAGGVRRK